MADQNSKTTGRDQNRPKEGAPGAEEHLQPPASPETAPADVDTPAEPAAEVPAEPAAEAPAEPALEVPAESVIESTPAPRPEPSPEPEPVPDLPEHHEEHAEEHHEEEGGRSFASRVLTALVILILGAALGIWGAPRLAPMLPSGLAPVARWLTPGQADLEAKIAALETEHGTAIADLRDQLAGIDLGALEGRLTERLDMAESATKSELDALREDVANVGTGDLTQRISRIEAAVDGQRAELGTLKEQMAGGAGGALSAEAVAQIDVYRAELEGLRAEFSDLSAKVAGLTTRVDEAAAAATRRVERAEAQATAARTSAEIQADLAQIRSALANGQPYADALGRLTSHPGVTVPEVLAAPADAGVLTLAALRDRFPDAAHAAIRASVLARSGGGFLARSRAFLEAQVASRSLTPQEGTSPDAVLSRMEAALGRNDLDAALAEAGSLPSEATAALGDWLAAARARAGAVDALEQLNADLTASN